MSAESTDTVMSTQPLSATTSFSLNGRCQPQGVKRVQHGVSWTVLKKCGILPHRGQKLVFHLCLNMFFMFYICFSADSSIIGTGQRRELLESWNVFKSKLWVDYVDGFYLGVWFHKSKTKRGQQRLKGWHRLDLLEERPSHWYKICADSQWKILIRASKMAGGFWGFNFKIERTRPSIACWMKLGIVDIINNLAGFTLQAWNFAIREKAFIFDLKNWTSPTKIHVRLICCKQVLFDGTDWLTNYTRTSSCK